MNKKIIWILIILAIIVIGAGIYFWITGDITERASTVKQSSGGSVPQPPALPE